MSLSLWTFFWNRTAWSPPAPGAFQLSAFQSGAFQDNRALAAALSLSGTATASFAPNLAGSRSIALAGTTTLTPAAKDAMSVSVGSTSRGAFQDTAFQLSAYQDINRQILARATVSFTSTDLRKVSIALSVNVSFASAAAGVLRPSATIAARAGLTFASAGVTRPINPLISAKARIDLAPTLVRGGGGKRRRPGVPLRQVEPEVVPPTFERFLKERKPTALADVIAADRVAPLLKGFVPADVGWVSGRRPRNPPPSIGQSADYGLRPNPPYDFSELEDELDAMAAIDGMPDPAVIHAQHMAAEAQDLRDIEMILARL